VTTVLLFLGALGCVYIALRINKMGDV